MESKKIVFLMRNINLLGGIETVSINYANSLCNLGYSVDILNIFDESTESIPVLKQEINVLPLGFTNTINLKKNMTSKILNMLSVSYKIKRILRKQYASKDVIFIVSNPVYALYIPRKHQKNAIIQVHASVEYIRNNFKLTAWVLKLLKKKVKKIIFLTNANMQRAIKYELAIPEKATYVYNFVYPMPDKLLEVKQKKIIMLTRFSSEKNIDIAISCFGNISREFPQWILELYGDGPDKDLCKDLIIKKGLPKQVYVHNSTDEIGKVLEEASVYINTSDAEGFSMAMLEAMSYGLNVIMFNNTIGLDEIIDDKQNGFIIDMYDEIELENTLRKVLGNMELRKEISENAYNKSKQFSKTNSIQKLINIIEDKE